MTGSQQTWSAIAGVILLVGGVLLAGIYYGTVVPTVLGGLIAVAGLALLRYAFLRRTRARRA